jgi:ankyrin repeat protein
LLAKGADLTARDRSGRDALHYAASSDSTELVAFLLDAGLAMGSRDVLGQTALHAAANGARPGVVRLLLDRGADITVTSKSGAPPLLCAVIAEVERNDRDILAHERACDPRPDAAKPAGDEPALRAHASW